MAPLDAPRFSLDSFSLLAGPISLEISGYLPLLFFTLARRFVSRSLFQHPVSDSLRITGEHLENNNAHGNDSVRLKLLCYNA